MPAVRSHKISLCSVVTRSKWTTNRWTTNEPEDVVHHAYELHIRALKPQARPYKVPDSDGLFLLVQPTGAPLWRFRFKVFGTERKLSLAPFLP
ncbi:Arm DNA-binding domain-containing protein [Sphingomonas sp. dw_22]|uniref:Arm DNA-binding domain-containing protein n=1 Tax=Sphingomonas sp. dw_22 TaxID=2721175 RepID=UPI0031FEB59B